MADKLVASCISSRSTCSPPLSLAVPLRNRNRHPAARSSFSVVPTSSSSSSSCSSSMLLLAPTPFIPGAAAPRQSGKVPRVTCAFGGEKRDAARKALESALGEKKDAFSKWDEEIKKREAGGGGGSKGRGRGWGSGGGGGDDSSSEESGSGRNKWGEAIQVVYAFVGLSSVYLVLTRGSSMLAFIMNSLLYVSRGFKPPPTPRYMPSSPDHSVDAESHVRNKWGSDD